MPIVDSFLSIIGVTLSIGVLAFSVFRRSLRRHFFVNLYAAAVLLCDGLRYLALRQYSFNSKQYFYTFYVTDALLITVTYLLILSFFDVIFAKTTLRSHVRWTLLFFVILVGWVSQQTIANNVDNVWTARLLVEFLQNMYFAAVILTVLVWISFAFLRVHDRELAGLMAGLGIALSAEAIGYAVQCVLPHDWVVALGPVLRRVPMVFNCLQMGLWCRVLNGLAPRSAPEFALRMRFGRTRIVIAPAEGGSR